MAESLRRSFRLVLLACLMVVGLSAQQASASHFRFHKTTWTSTGNPGEVRLHTTVAYQGGFGSTTVGTIFNSGETFFFGDGTTGSALFRVVAYDQIKNFIVAELVDGSGNVGLLHTYQGVGPFRAGLNTCCRIANLNNRSNGNLIAETIVFPTSGNSSPVSSVSPIVVVPRGPAVSFSIPAADPNGDAIRWRLATDAEAGGGPNPPNISINPNTGQVTWNNNALNGGGIL